MSIKEEFVWVTLSSKNIKHYEKLGYIIEKLNYDHGTWHIKRGTKILVKVSDLSKGSNVKITAICECPTCDYPERILKFCHYKPICKRCYLISEEHRLKKSGENNPMYGVSRKGKDHPNWKSDKTNFERINGRCLPGLNNWKKDVKERDNYTCQCCGFIGKENDGKLRAHHLNNYLDFPEQRLDINNGITLCKDCHSSANGYSYHTINGIYNNTKEQFIDWLFHRNSKHLELDSNSLII